MSRGLTAVLSTCIWCTLQLTNFQLPSVGGNLPLCAGSIIIPTAMNFLGDTEVEGGSTAVKWELAEQSSSKYSIYLALILALCALFNAMIGLVFFEEKLLQMCVGLVVAVVLVLLAHLWLPPTQRSCNLYMFASSMLYINIQGALDYWYTADEVLKETQDASSALRCVACCVAPTDPHRCSHT